MWPEGGRPDHADPSLANPHCVIVEFDDVNFGADGATGEERTFFPGQSDKRRWVPIFRQSAASGNNEKLTREQFPLTLAWALTHWKAQGMTLPCARVRLSKRSAALPGIAFVAMTRVKHPRHLVFETDLPDWEDFQVVLSKKNFRARRRYEYRMLAKASRTLGGRTANRYVVRDGCSVDSCHCGKCCFCETDPWTVGEADLAIDLLQRLNVIGHRQRPRAAALGRPCDEDAWLWYDTDGNMCEPDFDECFEEAIREYAANDDALRGAAWQVAARLRHDWHMPAVREKLGCLIPLDLHPTLDARASKRKRAVVGGSQGLSGGLSLKAGAWELDVFQEEAFLTQENVAKGVVGFFEHVLQRVAATLDLPLHIASFALGHHVGKTSSPDRLLASLPSWKQWKDDAVREKREMLMLVHMDETKSPRDWIVVRVASAVEGELLGDARSLSVHVYDRVRRMNTAKHIARNVDAMVRGLRRHGGTPDVNVVLEEFPVCDASHEVVLAALGLLVDRVAFVAEAPGQQAVSVDYVRSARAGLRSVFASLRIEAQRRGERDVNVQLKDKVLARKFFEDYGKPRAPLQSAGEVRAVNAGAPPTICLEAASFQPARVLTWNISSTLGVGPSVSVRAPSESWTSLDNLVAVQQEISRWQVGVVGLQECPSEGALKLLGKRMQFIGAAKAHAGNVHLYVAKGFPVQRVPLSADIPAVMARVTMAGFDVDVAALHLCHGASSDHVRMRQLRAVMAAKASDSLIVLGDFNAKEEEVRALCSMVDMEDAVYSGKSWDPKRNLYFPEHQGKQNKQAAFSYDRVLFSGATSVQSYLVGTGLLYSAGQGFCLSDHFGVLGLLDVHAAYVGTDEGSVKFARRRREALARCRDDECCREGWVVKQRERDGKEKAALERLRAGQAEQEDFRERVRADAACRRTRRNELRAAAFGDASLFADRLSPIFEGLEISPSPAADVSIGPYEGLLGLGAREAFAAGVRSVFPSRQGLVNAAGFACYANSACQVLLRLPAVALWLDRHAELCGSALSPEEGPALLGGSSACVCCALWRTRAHLGVSICIPELVARRRFVNNRFNNREQHDSVDFVQQFLEAARTVELNAFRFGRWDHIVCGDSRGVATHVDRLFAFVSEERLQCCQCGSARRRFTAETVLQLDVPEDRRVVADISEAYLTACRAVELEITPPSSLWAIYI
jgi:endonuclease/exonuclease/phosphatase family metal-dependent hydrolase